MTLNEKKENLSYLLATKGFLVINEEHNKVLYNEKEIAQILNSFHFLGFKLDNESFNKLQCLSIDELKTFYFESFPILNELVGNNVEHIVFYKNFPNMENMTHLDYFLNAILHYYTADDNTYGYMPNSTRKKCELIEHTIEQDRTIKIINKNESIDYLKTLFTNLLEGKKAITNTFAESMNYFMEIYGFNSLNPKSIPHKDNLKVFYDSQIYAIKALYPTIKKGDMLEKMNLTLVKTYNDLLRLFCSIAERDNLSYFKKTKRFTSLDRKARRILLGIFNNITLKQKRKNYVYDDLEKNRHEWLRFFEVIHPGEYNNKYPKAVVLISKFRNNYFTTYSSDVNNCLEENNYTELCNILKNNPGYFARSLDYLIRKDEKKALVVINAFKLVINKISTPLLINLIEHFTNRKEETNNRNFYYRNPKDSTYLSFIKKEDRVSISNKNINRIIKLIQETLEKRFSSFEKIEKVYVSEDMKNYTIPLNNENASNGLKTLSFGSKIKLEQSDDKLDVLRFFTHWKNKDNGQRVDLDLSLELFDEKFHLVKTLNWMNLNLTADIRCFHSGDITSAPEGASEFIDLNFVEARKIARYALINNILYTGGDYSAIPECFSGVMFRNGLGKKGEIFEPSTVQTKFDLTQKASALNVSLAVDLETLELIWIDSPKRNRMPNCVSSRLQNLSIPLIKAKEYRINIYDLVMLHKNHLSFVKDKSKANYVIDIDGDLTPFNQDVIVAKWL